MTLTSLIITNNTTLTAIIMFALGIWVYFDRPSDPRNITFGTMLATVSVWIFSLVLWNGARDPDSALFWLRTLFFVSSLIPVLFLVFVMSFMRGKLPLLGLQIVLIIPNAFLFLATYYTNFLVNLENNAQIVIEEGRLIFAAHFALFLTAALLVLFAFSRQIIQGHRSKLIFILIGSIIAFNSIFGILYGTNFISASSSIFIANIGLVIGMSIMTSSVLHKRFLAELKLLGPQIFALLTLFVIIFNLVVTQTIIDFTLSLIMIVILILYAALTTSTMVQEVRRMQRVEELGNQTLKINGELIKADKMKTRFVSIASHQLRAPIHGIRTYLEMFVGGDFGPLLDKQKEILDANITALTRLSETIDTFLDATKIQLGKLLLFKTETDIPTVVRAAAEELRPVAKHKNIELKFDIEPDITTVLCDEGKIYHVIINLLDNAIKYTKKGAVTVSVKGEKDSVCVRIIDMGIGLTDAEKSNIFNVFNRGMEAVRLDTGGSGLGLFIVKNILDAHKAEMIVESKGRDKGSTFGFHLPIT